MTTKAQARRAKDLHLAVSAAEGNALEGLRLFTEEPTNVMCRRLHLDPSMVRRCLGRRKGRKYNTTRRALELGLDLPPYTLDHILDADHDGE